MNKTSCLVTPQAICDSHGNQAYEESLSPVYLDFNDGFAEI